MCGTYSDNPTYTDVERVRRGAMILDQAFPGWEHQVDLMTLDIGSNDRCVLAQVGRAHHKPLGVMVSLVSNYLPMYAPLYQVGFSYDRGEADWRTAEVRLRKAWGAAITYRQATRPKARIVESQTDYELAT